MGLGGDFEITWRAAGGRSVETPVVLESEGRILVRIDSQNIGTEATLTVRSYGEPFDSFRVRLPRGTELMAGTPAGYSVVPIETGGKTADERLVEVRLGKRTIGPVEVQLNTRRAYENGGPGERLELSGFDVVKRRGNGVILPWRSSATGTYCGASRAASARSTNGRSRCGRRTWWPVSSISAALFTPARLVPRKPHINAEAEYRLSIDAEQAQLETRLKYTIRGAKISELKVKLGDWQFDEVQPERVGAEPDSVQVLSIPLQPSATGPVELTVRAHRPGRRGRIVSR